MWKWIVLALVAVALVGLLAVTLWVQREEPFRKDMLAQGERGRGLILYHPSRDAHFSDDLTLALARGFAGAGFSAERWTMSAAAPARPEGFAVVAVVSNTFYGRPDWPTMRYLARADLKGLPAVAIMAGSGATAGAEARLRQAVTTSGARLQAARSLWIARPNDETRMKADNRAVAGEIAEAMARDLAASAAPAAAPASVER